MIVVCNGMMRSGSTLQYNLVRLLIENLGLGAGEGFYTGKQIIAMSNNLRQWAQEKEYHVIKTHEFSPLFADMASAEGVRFFYIFRDIRDVALSLKIKFGRKDKSLMKALDVALRIYEKMKLLDEVLWQKYEAVVSDIPTAIREQAQFLGINPSDEIISAVGKECSIETAKRTAEIVQKNSQSRFFEFLKLIKMSRRPFDKITLLHPEHISENEGAVGLWRTQLEQDEIKEIAERYLWWLCETGYLP